MTDPFGNIAIRRGLRGTLLRQTVRHETVHSFLSPGPGRLQVIRAQALTWGYRHSHLLRYTEEAAAQAYGTGSLWRGLKFPFEARYGLSPWRVTGEAGLYIGGTGATSYFLSEKAEDWFKW